MLAVRTELLFLCSETLVMGLRVKPSIALIGTLLVSHVSAQSLSIDSHDDILESAAILAEDVLTYHYDTDEPGLLSDDDYRFWQSSVLWTALIDYHRLTGDEEYDDAVTKGLLSQRGANDDFLPPGQRDMQQIDHCLWGSAALFAAESGLSDPSGNDEPRWIELAHNVFERLKQSLDPEDPEDDESCGGGLRAARRDNSVGWFRKDGKS